MSTLTKSAPTPTSLDWWVRDEGGRLTVIMWPNAALSVWIVAALLKMVDVFPAVSPTTLGQVAQGALIAWSLDELIRGASPFRRVLGAVVLVAELVTLLL